MPPVYHTVTLRNPDKSKLSKRLGHTDARWFQKEGYLPEAILNFQALLGWSHPDEKEIFSLSEFIALFDLKDISSAAPIFDLRKLTWMNQQYIQNLSDRELKKRILSFSSRAQELSAEILEKLLPLVKSRMETLKDFDTLTEIFFAPPLPFSLAEQERHIRDSLQKAFSGLTSWDETSIFAAMKEILLQYKVRMSVLYGLLTGKPRGLPLPETIAILGEGKNTRAITAAKHSVKDTLARIISYTLNPILLLVVMPFFLLYRGPESIQIALFWTVYSNIFIFMILGFLIYGVRKKIFTDFDVSKRKQRPILFLFGSCQLLIYIGGIFLFDGPKILAVIGIGLLGGVILVSIINTRIKASIHIATLTGMIVPIILSRAGISVMLLGLIPLVGWSRVRIKRHTVPETIVGGILGAVLSLLLYFISQSIYD